MSKPKLYAGKVLVFKRVDRAVKRARARKKKISARDLARRYRQEVLKRL